MYQILTMAWWCPSGNNSDNSTDFRQQFREHQANQGFVQHFKISTCRWNTYSSQHLPCHMYSSCYLFTHLITILHSISTGWETAWCIGPRSYIKILVILTVCKHIFPPKFQMGWKELDHGRDVCDEHVKLLFLKRRKVNISVHNIVLFPSEWFGQTIGGHVIWNVSYFSISEANN